MDRVELFDRFGYLAMLRRERGEPLEGLIDSELSALQQRGDVKIRRGQPTGCDTDYAEKPLCVCCADGSVPKAQLWDGMLAGMRRVYKQHRGA
jgi:hypothetical protein